MFKLFHKHNWSKWYRIRWTEARGSGMLLRPQECKGILRYCIDCGKEDRRDGSIWQVMLTRGEL